MKRSPAGAFWLSVIPGAGHVYVGQPLKGFVLVLLIVSAIQLADQSSDGFVPLVVFLWIFGMLDAHRIAQETNLAIDTGRPLPSSGGGFALSQWWGWALVGIGVVFTLDNFGLFDMDWLWNLWPLGLIALGVYIIRRPATLEPSKAPEPPLPSVPSEPEPEPQAEEPADLESPEPDASSDSTSRAE